MAYAKRGGTGEIYGWLDRRDIPALGPHQVHICDNLSVRECPLIATVWRHHTLTGRQTITAALPQD